MTATRAGAGARTALHDPGVPREVEEILLRVDGVRECAVIGNVWYWAESWHRSRRHRWAWCPSRPCATRAGPATTGGR